MHLSDELVSRHGVAKDTAIARNVRASEPNLLTVVMLAENHRVMQAANRTDVRAMLLQGHQRPMAS